jgi:hypothetical protein
VTPNPSFERTHTGAMGPFSDGWTCADVERVLAGEEAAEMLYAPIVVGMNAADCGAEWAEQVCLRLIDHPHFQVRANARTGLGHIARTTGRLSDPRAFGALELGLTDQDERVRSSSRAAVEDLGVFLRGGTERAEVERLLRLARTGGQSGDA